MREGSEHPKVETSGGDGVNPASSVLPLHSVGDVFLVLAIRFTHTYPAAPSSSSAAIRCSVLSVASACGTEHSGTFLPAHIRF